MSPRNPLALARGFLDRATLAIWLERWLETQGRDGELLSFLECRHALGDTGMGFVDAWIVKDGQTANDLLPIVWDRLEEYASGIQDLEPQFKFLPSFGEKRAPGPPYPFKFNKPIFEGPGNAMDGEDVNVAPTEKSFTRMIVNNGQIDRKLNQVCSAENFRQLLVINQAIAADNASLRAALERARVQDQIAFEAMQEAGNMTHVHKMDAEKQAKGDARKDQLVAKVSMLLPYAIQMGLTKLFGPAAKGVLGVTSNPQLEKVKGALASILSHPGTVDKLVPILSEASLVGTKVLFDVVQEWVDAENAAKAKIDEAVARVVPDVKVESAVTPAPANGVPAAAGLYAPVVTEDAGMVRR